MQANDTIQYLRRHQISDAVWNACIDSALNGLVYGYTWYLDAMADDWDGLVLNDYEAVMPLPWRKKWGVAYLYQPFLIAQGGVFGKGITAQVLTAFLQAVPKQFRYWDISLNHGNLFEGTGFPLYARSNYVLSLNKPYEELHAAYRENIRRNIKRSERYGCTTTTGVELSAISALTKRQANEVPDTDFQNFASLFQRLQAQGLAKTYGVLGANGDLLAAAAFLFSNNRAYYILVGNHPNGRTLGASHAVIDAFIRDHAGQNLLLDFEGSDMRNLAFFYSSFGGVEEKYAAVRLNRLPWWAKWVK